ncbi:hypothetical protein Daus18300_001700 [Diaporthe australafricana]|uniref:Integral membrane protein n=1 Tax=Diaporthe australafricana TaxID=127596 RepID=A0ABR3XV20_9PEZI
MAPKCKRFATNRFSPLDTSLGSENTAQGMTQDVYEPEDGETTNCATFPYARLPFELRQMVLRELVPTKSIWNGTSFPKSCPEQYQQGYFEKTKYLQNRAPEDAWGRNETAVASLLSARLVDSMFNRDINAFFSHECTYWLMMGATEFFLFKCLALGTRYHHLFPRQANSFPTCYGDQVSWGHDVAYKSPLWHHHTLRMNRLTWKDIVESRWDRGPLRPGYLKFIGRFRNLRIVCFMGHIPEADEAVTAILNGISAKPAWRNWEPPRFPKFHFTFHHYVGYHCQYLCPECEQACSAHRSYPPGPDWINIYPVLCTSVGVGRESWFSTCAGCVNCLGSTESVEVSPSNWHTLFLSWEPGLRRRGPSAYNLQYNSTKLTTEDTLCNPILETWDDPVRAAILRISPEYVLDPDGTKQIIQPMYGKEGLVDAWDMWNKWAHHAWDRVTFATQHERVGFYWSRAFPDTTRFEFSSKVLYSDPLVPGKKYRLDFTGQFVGRHDATQLLRSRGAEEEKGSAQGQEESDREAADE